MPLEFEESTFHSFITALRDELIEREGLQGVQVTSAPVGNETDPGESVWFHDIDLTQTWGLIGNRRRDETFTVEGVVWVQREGAGEDLADEVRGRAHEILSEIGDTLRVKVTTDRRFKGAEFARARIAQGFNDGGRICRIDFAISVNESLSAKA